MSPTPPVRNHPLVLEFAPRAGARCGREAFISRLTAQARGLGFARLGVASAHAEEETRTLFARWLGDGHQGTMQYLESPRLRPEELLPGAKSVVVGAMSYGARELAQQPIAAYARADDYHHIVKQAFAQLGQACADLLGQRLRARACVDSAPVLERAWAARSGVAFVGKSTLAIAPGVGTATVLGELVLDVELPTTPPQSAGCGTCTRCLDACPTRAFVEPYVLDSRRCISYLTIEYRGWIPRELRPLMGTHVFGCDICQRTCPYNWSRKLPEAAVQLSPRPARTDVDLVALLQLTSGDYRRLVKGSAMRRASRAQLQRNAAIALGNQADPSSLEPLEAALFENERPLVRGHVAWALGQLATPRALDALRRAAEQEPDGDVLEEIRLGLVAGTRAG